MVMDKNCDLCVNSWYFEHITKLCYQATRHSWCPWI